LNDRLPIAVDAMGGDHAPGEIVRGAVDYARERGRSVLLVGVPERIERALAEYPPRGARVELVPASEVIGFEDKLASIRSKRDSSIHVGARLVRDGTAAAFVSAGHTGAFMAVSKMVVGLIEGVDRPVLPAPLPRRDGGRTVIVDAGANVDCTAEHLRQFAVMGREYARTVMGVDKPRVALLSIGGEEMKGNTVLREVSRILRETEVAFVGNVEGNDVFSNRADVVVCDGFVGNIVLKVSEGLAEGIVQILRDEVRKGGLRRLGALAMRPVFRVLKKKTDYAEHGAVPLLGLKGVGLVAHGRSHARAIRNALQTAALTADSGVVATIGQEIERLHHTEQRLG
jgi:glycerol-3-phosphate acyltransferase PlsX